MLSRVRSASLVGIDAVLVDVEVDMVLGLPYFNVVGLPEGAVRESKVRVISALKNCGYELPQKRITVNLAPADLRKDGATFELPIALGVLAASGFVESDALAEYVFGGELSLDGAVKPIRGVLPLALAARDRGLKGVVVPKENAAEAALVDRIEVIGVASIQDAMGHITRDAPVAPYDRAQAVPGRTLAGALDMADVRGQSDVKDALEVAAAGGHNILLCGPPGSGKTMLARRLPTIMPSMAFDESLEVTKVYSILGLTQESALVRDRPFRSPHHTISDAGLVGGGPLARPGELSMAHRGVLFLDELPEFRKHVLEVLRQPLEEGVVRIARAAVSVAYPCQVMLVAAMNPCPCGYFNVVGRRCNCPSNRVAEYHARISGPLLDRIDVTLETRPVELKHLTNLLPDARPSSWYRSRVEEARLRQAHRFRQEPGVTCNSEMNAKLLAKHAVISSRAKRDLELAVQRFGLSARAHDRILKLARTRADVVGHPDVQDDDVRFAISCRVVDRRAWSQRGDGQAPRRRVMWPGRAEASDERGAPSGVHDARAGAEGEEAPAGTTSKNTDDG